ncbi:MAG: hypothetical protein GXP45_01565 [bacterium]|nr:hypothetical protein [bacterium]
MGKNNYFNNTHFDPLIEQIRVARDGGREIVLAEEKILVENTITNVQTQSEIYDNLLTRGYFVKISFQEKTKLLFEIKEFFKKLKAGQAFIQQVFSRNRTLSQKGEKEIIKQSLLDEISKKSIPYIKTTMQEVKDFRNVLIDPNAELFVDLAYIREEMKRSERILEGIIEQFKNL